MKNIIAVLLIIMLVSVSQAQQTSWQQVSPMPQGNPLDEISVLDANTLFACGANGTFMSSTTGGETWFVDNNVNGLSDEFYSVYFANSQTGWLSGEVGDLLKTTDGGRSWTQLTSQTSADLLSVSFAPSSTTTGWACGSYGTILKTTDGGNTWVAQTSGVSVSLFSIFFINATTGWVAGGGVFGSNSGIVLKTTDGGTTWNTQLSATTTPIFSITFSDANNGWFVDQNGDTYHTNNGGTTWTNQPNVAGLPLQSVEFISSTIGWAAGAVGTVIKTTNGGSTWVTQTVDTYKDLSSIQFADANNGWAVGDYGTIFKTTNGGTTWVRKSGVTKTDLYGAYFSSAQTGYCVGDEGTVLKTTDGGYTWANKNTDSVDYTMYGTFFATDNAGWVVGDYGLIFKTNSGGTGWTTQSVNADFEDALQSVYFLPDAVHGWISGDAGDILRTTNGGATWIAETTNVSSYMEKVQFLNANIGWAVGDYGTIIKSTDGGIHWVSQDPGPDAASSNIYSLTIIDQNTVYACGDGGLILVTRNGGTNWYTIPQPDVVDAFKDIAAIGQNIWAAGESGIIYSSHDGGATWSSYTNVTGNTFWMMEAIQETNGALLIAAGDGNMVVKSALSPLPMRKWTGNSDSLWTNALNWTPNGVPDAYDSVYIPSTTRRPTIRQSLQQVTIASLSIASGGQLYIGGGVSAMIISGPTYLDGSLQLETNSRTDYISGGGVVINNGTITQGYSPITINGTGVIKGTFKDLLLTDSSVVTSVGNVSITNTFNNNSILNLRQQDTLVIVSSDTAALSGNGMIESGTIKRAIAPGSTGTYTFESPATYVQFYPGGTNPSQVLLTSYPGVLSPTMSDTVFVKRYYVGKAIGGSNYMANVALAYYPNESDLYPDQVGFFVQDSTGLFVNLGSSDYIDGDFTATILDSVTNFTQWYLGDNSYYPKDPLEYLGKINITDNGSVTDSLGFGALRNATPGIDVSLNEIALGSIPPTGTFDVRWMLPTNSMSKNDYRPFLQNSNSENDYVGKFQPGPGGYPITITWNLSETTVGMLFIEDSATGGNKFKLNMKTNSSVTISDTTITSFLIIQKGPFNIQVNANWNIVSMPVTPVTSNKKSFVFPNAKSSLFYFQPGVGYVPADSLRNRLGYWLKFAYAQTVGLEGTLRLIDTFTVAQGWNMVGSISVPIPAIAIKNTTQPSGIVQGNFFGYDGGYQPKDTITPGKGYWVKTSASGKLFLSGSALGKNGAGATTSDLQKFDRIIVSDNNKGNVRLYVGDEQALNEPLSSYELPPLPPTGIFDARFTTGRMLEPLSKEKSSSYTIAIQSDNYPVTVHCEGAGNIQYINVTDAMTGRKLGTISADGKSVVKITNPAITRIGLSVKSGVALPKVYSLEQNYPNPFNPTTTIQFNLPDPSIVTLQIFNVLGQQVTSLVDHSAYDPGSHFVSWNAADYSSGVYFYRLIATRQDNNAIAFQQVKKLMLVK